MSLINQWLVNRSIQSQTDETSASSKPRPDKPANQLGQWFNRRKLLGTVGLVASSTAIAAANPKPASNGAAQQKRGSKPANHQQRSIETAVAKQEIAELRCLYAKATDLIGTNKPEAVAQGRQIYHHIFKSDAVIGATGRDQVTGPDAWVEVVLDALKVYEKTQHLIGTQLVDIQSLPGQGTSQATASMSSYLQAWHAKADGELWLFIGSYTDRVVHSQSNGWQIADMMLEQISGETRMLNQ